MKDDKNGGMNTRFEKGPIPDTIYRAYIDGHAVLTIYHSDVWHGRDGEPLEVECDDEATRQKMLAEWKREMELDEEEIGSGRRNNHTTPEGVLLSMMERMAGGENAVEVVQAPELWRYGILL